MGTPPVSCTPGFLLEDVLLLLVALVLGLGAPLVDVVVRPEAIVERDLVVDFSEKLLVSVLYCCGGDDIVRDAIRSSSLVSSPRSPAPFASLESK